MGILNTFSIQYLLIVLHTQQGLCTTFPFLKKTYHKSFKNSFSPSTISEWNKLDPSLPNSESFLASQKNIFQFIRPATNSAYNCLNPKMIKLITRLRHCLSHLRGHKFKHNFQESLNPLCSCGHGIESTKHCFLHCQLFTNERYTLLSTLNSITQIRCFFLTICLLIQIKTKGY